MTDYATPRHSEGNGREFHTSGTFVKDDTSVRAFATPTGSQRVVVRLGDDTSLYLTEAAADRLHRLLGLAIADLVDLEPAEVPA